jgi:transcription initiation factor TFIIIB Brf1 subunit/transcription initiation factor TFIIB
MTSCPQHPCTEPIEDNRRGDIICPECGLVILDRCIFEDRFSPIDNDFREESENFHTYYHIIIIDGYIAKLGLPDPIKLKSIEIYEKIRDRLVSKRLEIKCSVAVLIACRIEQINKTFLDLSMVSGLSSAIICRNMKLIEDKFDFKNSLKDKNYLDTVLRYSSLLNLSYKKSVEISELYEVEIVKGRNPLSILGACFYKVMGERIEEISKVVSISKTTLLKTYKILFN